MADFCNQCSQSLFDSPGDFSGLVTQEAWENGYAASALCEGCGPIQVDPEGNCVSGDCLEYGHHRNFSKLYFECHITIEPVFDERLEEVKKICEKYKFQVADLLMVKRKEDTPERSKFDTFATARHPVYKPLAKNMYECVYALTEAGFKVWRYKIEDTILDVRLK